MTSARREHIRKIAEIIRKSLGLEVPISLETLQNSIEELGGKIEFSSDMGEEKDAEIKREGRDFVISINQNKFTTDERKKFTLAHELGHLYIHMNYANKEEWDKTEDYQDLAYARLGYSEDEFDAHEFAGSFLMPEEEYKDQIKKHTHNGLCDLKEIAKYFGVSLEAAKTRGKWLGVLEW